MVEVIETTAPSDPAKLGMRFLRNLRAHDDAARSTQDVAIALAMGLVTAGVLLTVYGLTMAPDLTWANSAQDGGELVTAAVTLGVPHPPGYPTYVALGKLFSWLPVGTVAFRLNLLSSVTVAMAGGLLTALLWLVGDNNRGGHIRALAAGATVGLLPAVWSQATVAEVYGLNLALIAAFLFCLIGLRAPFASGVFLGLALTSHLSSWILLPMALILAPNRRVGRLAVGIGVGLLPLLLVAIFARLDSPVVWGDARTLSGWWWVISGQLYAPNLQLTTSANTLAQSLARPGQLAAVLVLLGGIALPLLGKTQSKQAVTTRWALGLTASVFGVFVLMYQTPDAYVLLIPGLFFLVWLAFADTRLPGWLALGIPVLLLVAGFNHQNLRDDPPIRPLVEAVLSTAPESAIVMTPGDRTVFTLWYFHHVEGMRPDLVVIDNSLFGFDWYRSRLNEQFPFLRGLEHDDIPAFLALNRNRPLCLAGLAAESAQAAPDGYTYRLGAQGQFPYLSCREPLL